MLGRGWTDWRASAAAAVLCAAPGALGQFASDFVPAEFEGVGLVDRRGEQVPLDLQFLDETGKAVTLRDSCTGERPVILTLVYYGCPQLCNLVLNGLVNGLNEIDWSAGREFDIVTVSFKPEEGPKLAEVKRRAYLTQYQRPTAAEGWHFLTGEAAASRALADAVGFSYRLDDKTGEYAHPSTITFLTPGGQVSSYLDDVVFEARDLRLALVEASEGRIGSPLDEIALFMCFQYDPESKSYRPVAWKIMRSGALLTMTLVACGLGVLWLREGRGSRVPREGQAAS